MIILLVTVSESGIDVIQDWFSFPPLNNWEEKRSKLNLSSEESNGISLPFLQHILNTNLHSFGKYQNILRLVTHVSHEEKKIKD